MHDPIHSQALCPIHLIVEISDAPAGRERPSDSAQPTLTGWRPADHLPGNAVDIAPRHEPPSSSDLPFDAMPAPLEWMCVPTHREPMLIALGLLLLTAAAFAAGMMVAA